MNVAAYVNHGRWVADCPECGGAEVVEPGQPTVTCGDQAHQHLVGSAARPHKLTFPKDTAGIGRALATRPTADRNWMPGETVKQLRAENLLHGVA